MEPPDFLGAEARSEWERMLPALPSAPSGFRRAIFAAYCQAYARWVQASRDGEPLGVMIASGDKFLPNPYLRIAADALAQMIRFAAMLGLDEADGGEDASHEERVARVLALLEGRGPGGGVAEPAP